MGGGATQKKDALNRLMKDNIALIVVLEALDVDQQLLNGKRQLLCVANTHIHANTEHNDVKLWQVHTLLKGLEKIATSAEIPMVVCGDFNSVPGSAAHSLLSTGRVPSDHPELGIDPFGILQPSTKLSHPLPLVSAYTNLHKPCLDSDALERQRDRVDVIGEPLFTNCTKDFNGALDYVFYTEDTLAPVSVLELPGAREVRRLAEHAMVERPRLPDDRIPMGSAHGPKHAGTTLHVSVWCRANRRESTLHKKRKKTRKNTNSC